MSNIELIVFLTAEVFLVFVVHELGHLLAARYFGVRVLNISVGVGPEIVGLTDQFGTRWSLAVIPFGSYIKMIDKEQSSKSASAIARAEIGKKSESLSSRSRAQRAAIYGAGSAANILVAPAIYELGQLYFVGNLAWPSAIDPSSIMALGCGLYCLSVGVFNLLPIPLHDGGKLVALGLEWFRGIKTS
jgi:regulator of sigma E protease